MAQEVRMPYERLEGPMQAVMAWVAESARYGAAEEARCGRSAEALTGG